LQSAQSQQEDILHHILHFRMRHAREQQAMDHARILLVKLPECGTAALAGLLD
jgi:hypothetical protein